VEELAQALGVTDNAVRAQLAALERDGLVRQSGIRRGGGKPSYMYSLTPEFEPVLSRAYLPLLIRLLSELGRRMPEDQLTEILREVGRRWAAEFPPSAGDPQSQLKTASGLLNQLGGVTEVESQEGSLAIQGYSCPLAVLVRDNPGVCRSIEALLSQLTGMELRECCDRSRERVRCCFKVS
jgi:predicted ArsR family transcriptional regulator